MKLLELFCGTKSVSKVADRYGFKTTTLDIDEQFKPDLCMSVLDYNSNEYYDLVWASPPCQCFSVASIGSNWTGNYQPKREETKNAIEVVKKTLEIIKAINPRFWMIENPRGVLRKMDFMQDLPRTTVSYCQYGDTRMKPTDLWNNFGFIGRICKNGMPCHQSAPRGSRTGTQGLKNATERGVIPEKLCVEIIRNILNNKVI